MGGETTGAWEQAGQPWTSGLKAWILLEACWVSGVEGPVGLSKNLLSCGPVTCGQLGSLFSHVHGYPQDHTLGKDIRSPGEIPPCQGHTLTTTTTKVVLLGHKQCLFCQCLQV